MCSHIPTYRAGKGAAQGGREENAICTAGAKDKKLQTLLASKECITQVSRSLKKNVLTHKVPTQLSFCMISTRTEGKCSQKWPCHPGQAGPAQLLLPLPISASAPHWGSWGHRPSTKIRGKKKYFQLCGSTRSASTHLHLYVLHRV